MADSLRFGVIQVFSTTGAFAALKIDGSVVTWGYSFDGGDSSGVASQLRSGVVQIFSTSFAFAALKSDGSVVTWGDSDWGGDSSGVASQLRSDVEQIFSISYAFAALKSDGSVVTWGEYNYNWDGDSSGVASQLRSGVEQIFSTDFAFAALKSDGSVVTWGKSNNGGDSSGVASQLRSGVVQIFSTSYAFAALKSDGSVVTWGESNNCGNSSGVASQLTNVVAFANPFTDDRLLNPVSNPTISVLDNGTQSTAPQAGPIDGVVNEGALPGGNLGGPVSDNGTFSISLGNATLGKLVVAGVDVTLGGTVADVYGNLTVTQVSGVYNWSYNLTSSSVDLPGQEPDVFAVTVTNSNGNQASDSLVINRIDDAPTARNDIDALLVGSSSVATGNVITGTATTSGAAGSDRPGADGGIITAIASFGVPGSSNSSGKLSVKGLYGVLTIDANGNYFYVRNPGSPLGVTDSFTYTLTDGNGDNSSATLTINVNNANRPYTPSPEDLEILAKDVVYQDFYSEGDLIAAMPGFPYKIDKIWDDVNTGLFAFGLTAANAPSILVFRGTGDKFDIWDDLNINGIGYDQFTANRDSLRDWIFKQGSSIPPVITGHSLGGALAQWLAADVTANGGQRLSEVVTFNSPGITGSRSFQNASIGADAFMAALAGKVTHYITSSDIVSLGGSKYIHGDFKLFDYGSSPGDS